METVESVPLIIDKSTTEDSHGTSVQILNLRKPFGTREATRLARALVLLSDPFENDLGFKAILRAPAYRTLERLVNDAYFDDAELHLIAELDGAGHASARVINRRGNEVWSTTHSSIGGERKYATVAARFDLWIYLLQTASFSSRTASLPDKESGSKL